MLVRCKKFLSTGSDRWPSEIFVVLGIDLTDKSVYLDGIEYFNQMIDKYDMIISE